MAARHDDGVRAGNSIGRFVFGVVLGILAGVGVCVCLHNVLCVRTPHDQQSEHVEKVGLLQKSDEGSIVVVDDCDSDSDL